MKKGIAILMALTMLLTLTACGKKADQNPPAESETKQETPVETVPELAELPELKIPAEKLEGRVPGGAYVLPEEVSSMADWYQNGAVALLAETGDVAFYALEGKESNPALLCWGDRQVEFDWLYETPRAVEPQLWVVDLDGDGREEVVADCYGGSGTGVSLEYLYVVEQGDDGSLIGYELPWDALEETLNEHLLTVSLSQGETYAALGRELVDISTDLEGRKTEDVQVQLGRVASYSLTEDGLSCSFGVVAVGGEIPPLVLYVATIEGMIRYEDGTFTLEDLHLLS